VNLRALQDLLYQRITAPHGAANRQSDRCGLSPSVVEALVHGDERLSAAERVGIYADAYFFRLLDCLSEEFPATLVVLGADNFAALVKGYLLMYPPTEPSLLYAGRYLADFLGNHPFAGRWPFIAELARLERAVLDVFHAADAPALGVEALRAVPPGEWPALKLRTHPAVKIVHCKWRSADVLQAVEQGREWNDPEHEDASVLVWRQNALVHYRTLERLERDALLMVKEGAIFAFICEAVAVRAEETDHVALLGRLMARWLADGIIAATDAMPLTTVREPLQSGGASGRQYPSAKR
jgi:Putative DNA-binding domain